MPRDTTEVADLDTLVKTAVEIFGVEPVIALVIALRLRKGLTLDELKALNCEELVHQHSCMRKEDHPDPCVCHCGAVLREQRHGD